MIFKFRGMNKTRYEQGFTLIELLVVLAIVALLTSLALPRYLNSVDKAKETMLLENLRVTRHSIDKFYGDTGRYPTSLQELVEKRYLNKVPIDPITENGESWILIPANDVSQGGIMDIRCGASGSAKDGTPYSAL